MSSPKLLYADLLDALEFASAGASFDSSAFVDRETGGIHFVSAEFGLYEDVPADL
jgi:hypothetical protein